MSLQELLLLMSESTVGRRTAEEISDVFHTSLKGKFIPAVELRPAGIKKRNPAKLGCRLIRNSMFESISAVRLGR